MKQAFPIRGGTVEVVVDEASRTVGVYRFDDQHRNVAATMESWDHADLADVLVRKIGIAPDEAEHITYRIRGLHVGLSARRPPDPLEELRAAQTAARIEPAGVALRFVAVLLDGIIVLFPLALLVGLLAGGGYAERGPGYANYGIEVSGKASAVWLALAVSYYVLCEAFTGRTLGKRIVGIRVVDEEGDPVDFSAAVIRNLLRIVDGFLFYLVGAIFALASPLGQRLGDRAAGTVVVR